MSGKSGYLENKRWSFIEFRQPTVFDFFFNQFDWTWAIENQWSWSKLKRQSGNVFVNAKNINKIFFVQNKTT